MLKASLPIFQLAQKPMELAKKMALERASQELQLPQKARACRKTSNLPTPILTNHKPLSVTQINQPPKLKPILSLVKLQLWLELMVWLKRLPSLLMKNFLSQSWKQLRSLNVFLHKMRSMNSMFFIRTTHQSSLASVTCSMMRKKVMQRRDLWELRRKKQKRMMIKRKMRKLKKVKLHLSLYLPSSVILLKEDKFPAWIST